MRSLSILTLVLTACTSSLVNVFATKETGKNIDNELVREWKKSSLIEKMFPFFSKLFARRGDGLSFKQITETLGDVIDAKELAVFAAVGWGLVPVSKSVYGLVANVTGRGLREEPYRTKKEKKLMIREMYEKLTPWDDEKLEESIYDTITHLADPDADSTVAEEEAEIKKEIKGVWKKFRARQENKGPMPPFNQTFSFHVVDHVSQASRIGIAVALVDSVSHMLKLMGYSFQGWVDNASRLFSKIMYSGWITRRLTLLKRFILKKTLPDADDMGKLEVVDDLLNGVFYLIWLLHLLEYFQVQTGLAVKSLFSLGATGTLVFGLASKDLATQVISGITLHLSDKMFEGDSIRLSDGTSGVLEDLGWMETQIRNSDELAVRIPNSELAKQRIYNLSRTPRSQVKQTIRISYDDASKMPQLLKNIKEEIQQSCPKLITDGSRAFRAHWDSFEDDHLRVVIDCHFKIRPTGSEYYENRQKVLEAIYRAVKKSGVRFEVGLTNKA